MYAGVDKYGGAVVGEGQPQGKEGDHKRGVSLEDAIETASAEETVVVDVPYSYYEDDADPSTLVTGSSQVLLNAQLNPECGGLMWVEQESPQAAYKNVVAMSQMTSMLRDTDRNQCYERAIQRAIANFQAQYGRAPIVLDIGTGTGLLSMFAATHGAAHVYACEMFQPMAEIAHHVTQANHPDKITVFPLRSTDLIVSKEHGHLPQRADMLVSELFDSILLGEAVIPTIRHAMEHLLVPNAVIVPDRAQVFAQVVENEQLYRLNRVGDTQLNGHGVRLARNDAALSCTGSKPALPLHIKAFEKQTKPLTAPVPVLSFDFNTVRERQALESVAAQVEAMQSGYAHAVVMWWEVSFHGANDTITYSTQPEVQNWQDHWVQVVFPMAPLQSVQAGQKLALHAHHDDLRIWFDLSTASPDSTGSPQLQITAEKPPCVCGLHLLCNAERIAMLNDALRSEAYDRALAQAIDALRKPLDQISCLDISDGSLCALLAGSYGIAHVTSIESKDVSGRIFEQILAGNGVEQSDVLIAGVKGLLPDHLHGQAKVDLLVGEPFYYSMQNLPLWQAFNFWLRRGALQSVLHPTARILPAKARVMAMAVQFEHLHECFGAVGNVSGYDHSYFDQFQDAYYTRHFPFPAYMYPYTAVADRIELVSWKFSDLPHSLLTESTIQISRDQMRPNAVIVWTEFALDEADTIHVTTGPAVVHSKQLVRFLPPSADQSTQLRCVFQFNATEGLIELDVSAA